MKCCFTLAMIGACVFLVSGTAFTQTTYGLIEGAITDATGGALPGATITVVQPRTGFVRTVVTNDRGLYRAVNLNPAEYDLTVELRGFLTVTRRSIKIDVGQAVAVNLAMAIDTLAVVNGSATAGRRPTVAIPSSTRAIDSRCSRPHRP